MLYFTFKVNKKKISRRHNKWIGCIENLLFALCEYILPQTNHDFAVKIPNVDEWFVEYDDEVFNEVIREIGIDYQHGKLIKMPDKGNRGYWADSDYHLDDFKRMFKVRMITSTKFQELWNCQVRSRAHI
ncbi:MAG: hypothetical protein K6A82_04735 [Prevotella sp.]|nr:hypothetical protein [Prevotella sp.]